MAYPKCRSGFHAFGCCLCRPHAFNCMHHGQFDHQIDLSCAKKVIGYNQPFTGQCAADEEKQGGLCYKKCSSAYDGVGPVCWARPPTISGSEWVHCGMGAATDDFTCASQLADQILGPFEVVAAIATAGGSSAALKGTKAAKKAASVGKKLAKVTDKASEAASIAKEAKGVFTASLGDIVTMGNRLYDAAKDGSKVAKDGSKLASKADDVKKQADNANKAREAAIEAGKAINTVATATTPEEIIAQAASLASLVDPTGISSCIAAYCHPKCSKLTR